MVVQHNMQAANATRMLGITTGAQAKSTEKLSSGYRINRAADDAAGLSISEKMRKQIRGLDQASTNAQDGVSAVQTAEGALTEVHSMLQRMNELAVQAANGTNSETDRSSIQDEISQLTTEIDRVAETTKFNESYMLKGGKDTQVNILKGHDAGIKGTFVDGSTNATLKVDLSVGKSLKIGGQDYNIVSDTKANAATASDSLSKLQEDIKSIGNAGAKVTIDGTQYTASGSGKDLKFDAGTGTMYSAEEMSGKIKDGSTVSIAGATTVGGEAIDDADAVITRDYELANNITAQDAAKKIEQALTQANNIGATKTTASVTSTGTGSVQDITNGGKITAKEAMIAYDSKAKTLTSIGPNEDITDLYNNKDVTLYKKATAAVDLTSDDKAKTGLLIVHDKDTLSDGVEAQFKKGDAVSGTGVTVATHQATKATDYEIYEEINPVKDATFTDATHEAYAKLDNSTAIEFEKVTSQDMSDGQNALLKELAAGKISKTYTDTAGTAVFSHNFTDKNLDIDEAGEVTYKGEKIATLTNETPAAATTAGDKVAVKNDGATVDAEFVTKSDEYTFDITKGSTEVANSFSLNLHVGADADMTNKISIGINSMSSAGLGIAGINVADDSGMAATYAVDAIEDAIKTVSAQRSALGAVQNRLEHTIANVDNVVENSTAAESRIRDTDMADEMVNYSKNNILAQAGQSMLAQAKQSTQGVLSILG